MEEFRGNPFSTRHVRPGVIPYAYRHAETPETMLRRFEAAGRTGQIVGAHGSGKSALLADLLRCWRSRGEQPLLIELHDGQRRLPRGFLRDLGESRATLLAVDGYEQLGLPARLRLRRLWRKGGLGLIVTAHRSMGFPDIARCAPSLETVADLACHLLGQEAGWLDREVLAECFRRHDGNVREILFALYDLCEQRSMHC